MQLKPVRILSRGKSALLLIPLAAASAPWRAAPAQQAPAGRADTAVLRPVVVTATRIPTPIASVTRPVTVLYGAELRERGVHTVAEALRSVPGASVVQSGSYGAVTSLFLRGGESRYTKVLIDGVPVNDVGGGFFFQNLSLVNIDRIEVVEGPASALYGADAMSGVVQIFTRAGSGPATVDMYARAGSYGGREGALALDGSNGHLGYSLGGDWRHTDGLVSFNNQYSTGTLSGAVTLAPGAGTSARITSRYSGSVYHFPTNYAGVPNDTNSYTSEHRLVVGVDVARVLAPGLTAHLTGGDDEIHSLSEDTRTAPPPAPRFAKTSAPSRGYRRRAEGRVDVAAGRAGTLSLGSDYEVEASRARTITRRYSTRPADVPGTVVPGGDDHRTTRGYYVSAQGAPLARISYDASARHDNHSDYKNVTTYHAGLAFQLWSGARARASYGTGFNAPAFYETQGSAYNRPNPDLQPERARTLDFGIEQVLMGDRLSVSVGAFDQRFDQLIQYVAGTNTGPPSYTQLTPAYYANLTQARARGYQGQAQLQLPASLRASIGYTQLIAAVYSVPPGFGGSQRPGDALLRRPSHSGHALLEYDGSRGLSASANATYVGRRPDMDFARYPSPTVTLPAYVRLDLATSLPLVSTGSGSLSLTARVENALDRRYEDVLHFPAPRRAFLLGGRITAH